MSTELEGVCGYAHMCLCLQLCCIHHSLPVAGLGLTCVRASANGHRPTHLHQGQQPPRSFNLPLCSSFPPCSPLPPPPPSPLLSTPLLYSLLCLATRHESAEEDATIAAGILSCCLGLVSKLCQLYKDLPSFPELFSGISFNLQSVPDLCPAHQELRGHVLEVMSTVSAAPRPVLQLLKRKPKSIKFYEPSYNEM